MTNVHQQSRGKHAVLKAHVDEQRILEAIQAAEARTSGAIHVSIADRVSGDARHAAARVFRDLGYSGSASAAVLFFVVPSRRELAVIGGNAIHSRVGQTYWQTLVAAIVKRAQEEDLTSALVHGIDRVGRELARSYPPLE